MPVFPPVTALQRGLEVLRVVNALRRAAVADMLREIDLPRATLVRMLETLEAEGFVSRSDGKHYIPTGRVLLLSNGFQAHERVAQIADPILSELRLQVGWPSDVAIPDGDGMLIAVTSRPFDDLLLKRRVGARAPMLASALGRAYLAACPAVRRDEIIASLAKSGYSFDRLAANRSAALALLTQTRQRGYAVPDESYSTAIYHSATSGFAVPISVRGEAVGSINLAFLTSTIRLAEAISSFLPTLRDAARRIANGMEADLGNVAPVASPRRPSKRG
jgi:IclR family mhp operon transcriptional activator